MSSYKEVRYIMSRLRDPDDIDSAREPIGWHPYLDLAKKHADRIGAGACVDAEGGSCHPEGPYRRRGQWRAEWTNRNLYQAGKERRTTDGV